jgi:hypothetical protein
MADMIRQGDVLFVPITKLPKGAKLEKNRKIVAEGEVTGHHHKLVEVDRSAKVQVFSLEDALFAQVAGDVVVTHQEHGALAVDEGLYEIRIQQEYTPQEVRRVMD